MVAFEFKINAYGYTTCLYSFYWHNNNYQYK